MGYDGPATSPIGEIVKQTQPGYYESIKVTGSAEKEFVDIRQYLDVAGDKPFKGVTRKGVRLQKHEAIQLIKMIPSIRNLLQITDEDLQDEED